MQRPNARHVVLGALLLGSVLFLLHAVRGTGPKGSSPEDQPQAEASSVATAPDLRPAAPADVTFDRYAEVANTNVFAEGRSQPPKKPEKLLPTPPLPQDKGASKPPERKPDFAGWSYLGYLVIDGKQVGVLQNDTTKACKDLAVGDSFEGARVESIDRKAIRLRSGGSSTTLSRLKDFPVTPLEKTASGPARAREN